MSLEDIKKGTDTGGTSLSLENRYGEMLAELFRKPALLLFAEYVGAIFLVQGRHIYDGDTRVKSVKSGFVSEGFCSTSRDYDRSGNRINISETRGCVFHEHYVNAIQGFGAERKMIDSFVLMRDEYEEQKR